MLPRLRVRCLSGARRRGGGEKVALSIQSGYSVRELSPDLKATTFRLEAELLEGLQAVRERDGVSVTEQVRRAIRAWLEVKGVQVKKSTRKQVGPRKRV